MPEDMERQPQAVDETGVPPAPVDEKPVETQQFQRFHLFERIEHWTFMISFTVLGITGLVQKYSELSISQWLVNFLGGIEITRLIHRISATVMMLVVIYHIGEIFYKLYVNRLRPTMLPDKVDLKAVPQTIKYNMLRTDEPPQQGRYTFEEKMEYWAVVWGTVVMVITGFMMWNPIATTNLLSGEVIPAAKIAHGLEAVLAVSAIIIWHLYHVLVKTFNRSMFTGNLTAHQIEEEHPLELADIKAGLDKPAIGEREKKKRQRLFFPVYGVVALLGVAGIFWFVSFENTAITTVPPRELAEVYVPLTPTPLPTPRPTPTPAPLPEGGEALTWEAGIGDLFNTKCAGCHNSASKIGGLDLTSYQGALTGGNAGPAIIPGDAENSQVVVIQQAGGHPGQFSQDELDLIIQWIQSEAPEN